MICFTDLDTQNARLRPELDAAIPSVLDRSEFVSGQPVAELEVAFAAYCGTDSAFGVSSGTSALHLALLGAGLRPGDEVITTAFTFLATVAAISYAGARPVLVDISPASFAIDPPRIEAAITPRTRAIVPVHLYGQTADMDPILDSAGRHGLKVIEDVCQALAERAACKVLSIPVYPKLSGEQVEQVSEALAAMSKDRYQTRPSGAITRSRSRHASL